jgi:glycosyltransferase 2 family protein
MKKVVFYSKIVFIAALFTWIGFKFDYETAKKIFLSANIGWAVLALFATFATFLVASLRWKMIVRGFWENPKTSLAYLYWFNLLGVFYTLFLPTSIAGEAVRAWRLAKNEDKDYAKAGFTAIIDRVIGVFTWFILFIALPTLLPKNKLLLLLFFIPVALYFFKDKLVYKEKKLFDFSRHHPLDIINAVLLSFACQLVSFIAGYSVFMCFNIHIGILYTFGVLAAGALAGLIPISFLGFGAREGFFVAVLPLYGILPTQAVLVTSFFVLSTYAMGLSGGLIELMNTGWKLSSLGKSDMESIKSYEKT